MDSGDKYLVAVVIPIYKKSLTNTEIISLQQAIKKFERYPVIFMCPDSLDVAEYHQHYASHKEVNFERFPDLYFKNIAGYTRLLLSKEFYLRFLNFQYLMIYQLDGFVFRDELEEWCKKGYDYIGAPWFTNFASSHKGNELYAVGNGGVSLRNVNSCIKLLESNRLIKSLKEVFDKYYKGRHELRSFINSIPILIRESLGYQNNAKYFIDTFTDNEDHIWGLHSSWILPEFRVAPVSEALEFAFECDPSYLYKQNGNKLPFCCHAWEKWDPYFWRPFIEQEGYKLMRPHGQSGL